MIGGPAEVIRVGSAHDPTALPATGPRDRIAGTEMMVGGVLVALVAVGGLYFAFRPSPVVVDGWFSFLVGSPKGTWYTRVTVLRLPVVIIVGAIAAAAFCYRRDPPRAWACLIGPVLALATCELVAKPLVGRTLGGVFSYPSGSTTGAAALAAAAVLAVPARWRVGHRSGGFALWVMGGPRRRRAPVAPSHRRRLRPGLRRRRCLDRRRFGLEGGGPPAPPVRPASASKARPGPGR